MKSREEVQAEGKENAFRAVLEVLLDLRDQSEEALNFARSIIAEREAYIAASSPRPDNPDEPRAAALKGV